MLGQQANSAGNKAAPDIETSFWRKVHKTETCWLWTDEIDVLGYARFTVPNRIAEGKSVVHLAHRFAWQLLRGPLPDGVNLIHVCRVPRCVNPNHLEFVTIKES